MQALRAGCVKRPGQRLWACVVAASTVLVARTDAQRVSYHYDKLSDTTIAMSPKITYGDANLGRLLLSSAVDGAARPSIDITAAVQFRGTVNADTISTVWLTFKVTSMHSDAHNAVRETDRAPDTAVVRLLLDDSTRLSLSATLADKDTRFNFLAEGNAKSTYVYVVPVPIATFEQIVSAHSLEGSLYSSRFSFKEKYLRTLGSIRSVYAPGTGAVGAGN